MINLTSEKEVADQVEVADTFFRRLVGLIPRQSLSKGHGLLITPCSVIHTFKMKFPIDVVYLDKERKVVGMEEALPPNRKGKKFKGVESVLELPTGTIKESGIKIDDRLQLV